MGERVDVSELVGTAEIAARLGMKQQAIVHTWRRRYPGEAASMLDEGEVVARLADFDARRRVA